MKKILLITLSLVIIALLIFAFVFFVFKKEAKGALQVTSKPKSNVYLNGKIIGQTPLCKCDASDMLEEGEYTIRLVPLEGSQKDFEEKIKISKSVLTVVDRTFGSGASSEGSIISLNPLEDSKLLQLLVLSFPDNVEVFIDGSPAGRTPLLLKNITESDHEVRLSKSGYQEKTIRIRAVLGYKLTVLAFLGVNFTYLNTPTPLATPSALLTEKIVILRTPTGFLRVREEANLNSAEIARVYLNDVFEKLEEKPGWFKIRLNDGKIGWVSAQYAKKQ